MTDAQTHIDGKFPATEAKIEVEKVNTGDNGKDKILTKLKGKLIIKNRQNLTEIKFEDHELEELEIINCPNLTKINVGKNKLTKLDITKIKTTDGTDAGDAAPADKLTELRMANNADLEEASLEYCPKLKTLLATGCTKLKKITGLDNLKEIRTVAGVDHLISYIVSEKLDYYKEVVKYIRETLGLSNDKPLPKKPDGSLDKDKLKTDMENKIAGSANSERDQAKQEAQTAKAELTTAKAEKTNLENQLNAIKTELGVGNNANQQQIVAKIKELMGRPTSTHTDYDAIKSERDNLKTERDTLKTENARLKNDNKENVNPNTLRDNTKTNLEK
ncbi:26726_t:CDS:1 [Racocetra persica]|uniref:26726_t:CDS:1 n=1 Tax=Racocetra persica TaxID=160502 RepID=A0ACA9PPW0_9GLOM|nr:26726_t:CDS:1 [Racocetra persica]